MQTRQETLLEILDAPDTQYVIPVYQRVYAWTRRQCEVLWTDIMRAGKSGRTHFLSTLLCIPEPDEESGRTICNVVDGQQRLTTMTLLLTALAEHLDAKGVTLDDGVDPSCIRKKLLHCDGSVDGALRLVLSKTDNATLESLVNGTPLPANPSARVIENHALFAEKMDAEGFDVTRLWRGIERLVLVYASLAEKDSPQHVFESLNSKGMPLTTADLIRNFLLIAESHEEQARLYDEYWAPIEEMFAPDPGSLRLNNAIHGWLQVRYPKVRALRDSEVYDLFKAYVEDEYDGTCEELLVELRAFSLVWAENYKYHAVKAFRSKFNWAKGGKNKTLVSDRPLKPASTTAEKPSYRDIDMYL